LSAAFGLTTQVSARDKNPGERLPLPRNFESLNKVRIQLFS